MKILIVSQYYYPEQFLLNDIAPALVRRGHKVTVLCGLPNYPQGKIYEGYKADEKRREAIDGVDVLRCSLIPRGHNPLQLALNYLTFARSSAKESQKLPDDYDVILGYGLSPITSLNAAVAYKNRCHKPFLCYVLDIWPESAATMLHGKKNLAFKWVAKESRRIYQAADKILVSSKPFIKYMKSENQIPLERLGYLPQHADSSWLEIDATSTDNKVSDFMFAGNIGRGQHLETLVEAVELLKDRNDFMVHIVGDGLERKKIESMVKDRDLSDHFIFYGYQQKDKMLELYKKADALLILLRQANAVGLTMPGKLQTYMTLQKPIFGAINGAAQEVIHESGCGGCVNAEDANGLSQLMLSYIENPDIYKECGENAKNYFLKHFTLDNYITELESNLKELLN